MGYTGESMLFTSAEAPTNLQIARVLGRQAVDLFGQAVRSGARGLADIAAAPLHTDVTELRQKAMAQEPLKCLSEMGRAADRDDTQLHGVAAGHAIVAMGKAHRDGALGADEAVAVAKLIQQNLPADRHVPLAVEAVEACQTVIRSGGMITLDVQPDYEAVRNATANHDVAGPVNAVHDLAAYENDVLPIEQREESILAD